MIASSSFEFFFYLLLSAFIRSDMQYVVLALGEQNAGINESKSDV